MHKIRLNKQGVITEIEAEEGANLLKVIQDNKGEVSAPCGGNGTCGKCKVEVVNDGHVTSCLYYVSKDIEVILPEELEMRVLSSQYEFTKQMWVNPGASANLAPVPYGLAIDIGTTSIAFYVVNLVFGTVVDVKTAINPQTKFGADVISRINYGYENEGGIAKLQSVLIDSINNTLEEYYKESDLSKDDFVKVSIVGNTTMLHNLMGVDAISIALAPFTPQFTETKKVSASSLGINIHDEGEVVLAPSLTGYVGADIIAGMASLDKSKIGKTYLFIDIGTNGEMAIVTPEKTISCATAAGPAFEGANISYGMSATFGAVSRYSKDIMEVVGGTEPTGICGSGLIDIVGEMIATDVVNMEGNITEDFIVYKSETNGNTVSINQQDIREVQLAKSAIASGISRLLSIAGVELENLDNILLAGGFGNYIDVKNAVKIGLLPDVPFEKYIQIGNTAGTGAVLALKSEQYIAEMEELVKEMEYIELSTDDEFSMEFAMNMFF